MASYTWSSTSSSDPLLGANWTKSDGTVGTTPGAGDDLFIAAIGGITVASIWATGASNLPPPTSLGTSGASNTGGNLAPSTTYKYYVTAVYSTGESPISSELSYTTPGGTSTNQITVGWTAPSLTPSSYKIYRTAGGGASGSEQLLASGITGTNYADTTATVPVGTYPGGVTYNSINVSQSFTGTIGNAGIGGYWLTPCTTLNIGTPGSGLNSTVGSSRIKINLGSVAAVINIYATGSSADTGYEAVRLLGTSASNVLNVVGSGTVGIGTNQAGESATIATANVSGQGAICNFGSGVTWTNANVAGSATFSAKSGSTGTVSVAANSSATLYGTSAVASINNSGTVIHQVRPASGAASTTINNYTGGTIDFSGNPSNVTVTTLNAYANSQIRRNPANPGHLTMTTFNSVEAGNLTVS